MTTLPDFTTQSTISVPEAAQLLGVNARTVYNAVERGECPAIRVGRVIRIPTARFLATYHLEPVPQHSPAA
jgi:excisionase family DNA binding protein